MFLQIAPACLHGIGTSHTSAPRVTICCPGAPQQREDCTRLHECFTRFHESIVCNESCQVTWIRNMHTPGSATTAISRDLKRSILRIAITYLHEIDKVTRVFHEDSRKHCVQWVLPNKISTSTHLRHPRALADKRNTSTSILTGIARGYTSVSRGFTRALCAMSRAK